jgi:hypothetical protein
MMKNLGFFNENINKNCENIVKSTYCSEFFVAVEISTAKDNEIPAVSIHNTCFELLSKFFLENLICTIVYILKQKRLATN